MRTFSLLFLLPFIFFVSLIAQTATAQEYHLLIGTYASEGKPNGIYVYRFNAQSGAVKVEQPVTPIPNASYLAVSKDVQNVYALGDRNGSSSINAVAFDKATGALTFINSVPSQGPAYVSVDDSKKVVFGGNYGGGNVLSVHLNSDGSLATEDKQLLQHEGSSINKERQDKSHVHAVVLSPDGKYLLVPDLGTDKVYQYRIDADEKRILKPAAVPYMAVKPGSGPRHLAFHPNGKYAYLVLELEGAVMALKYSNGNLKPLQTISMVDLDFKGRVSGADIHVAPDGKFLYASNRGDANEIAIYSIGNSGQLTLLHRQSVLGKTPRNFAIDPTGNFLLVANQASDEVIIFKRNSATGLLTPTGDKILVDKPVCLKFAAVD